MNDYTLVIKDMNGEIFVVYSKAENPIKAWDQIEEEYGKPCKIVGAFAGRVKQIDLEAFSE